MSELDEYFEFLISEYKEQERQLASARLQVDDLCKALKKIDALRKRLPDPDFAEQKNTAAAIAEIVREFV